MWLISRATETHCISDPYANLAAADPALVAQIGDRLELRAADPQQRANLDAYLADVQFPPDARVLEIGCGTGPVARVLANWPDVGKVVGVDPSPTLVARAIELSRQVENLSFQIGDARALAFEDASFDVVVFHTVLCHVPEPDVAIREAHRVLRAQSCLAVFDGDYATATVAIGENDPLPNCTDAVIARNVHDRWLVRRLPKMLRDAEFEVTSTRSHGFVETVDPDYMLGQVLRGADLLVEAGRIGPAMGEALKAEAQRRAAEGEFFGHIAYASVIARKSA